MFKLGCPNCQHQITVRSKDDGRMIACDNCGREYCVPPLPRPQTRLTVTSSRPLPQPRQTRFNVMVSVVAVMTVIVSITGMLWLRGSTVHGEQPDRQADSRSADDANALKSLTGDSDVADFAPVTAKDLQPFTGHFAPVAELTPGQSMLAGTPDSVCLPPQSLTITASRDVTEILQLRWAAKAKTWTVELRPVSRRLGHGFRRLSELQGDLDKLGAYTRQDFQSKGAWCTVKEHRFTDSAIVVTDTLLTEAEFRRDIPLSKREFLCRVQTEWNVGGDLLTVSYSAKGGDERLLRQYVSLLHADLINARELKTQGLAEYQQAWLDGQTISWQRVKQP